METDVSIDNLTIMAHETPGFTNYIEQSPNIIRSGFASNFRFRYAYMGLDGSLIEHADGGKVRVEFNPNKANMREIESLMECLKYPYLTRMDIAIDYFGIDLSEYEWRSAKRRKRNYWEDSAGKLETLYIGAPASSRRYRIYNKLVERQEKDGVQDPRADNGHWRVEVQQRYTERETAMYDPPDYFLNDLFDIYPCRKGIDLSAIEGGARERAMIRGILEEPTLLAEFSKNVRPKYAKLIEQLKQRGRVKEIDPAIIYEKEKDHLASQLSDLLNRTFAIIR